MVGWGVVLAAALLVFLCWRFYSLRGAAGKAYQDIEALKRRRLFIGWTPETMTHAALSKMPPLLAPERALVIKHWANLARKDR